VNKRIKKLRKTLELTQKAFAERIGVKPNTIATYEIGRNQPIDAIINLICREFNVNENWLRTGEGDMFKAKNSTSLDDFLKKQEATELEIEIIKMLFSLDKKTREELVSKFKRIFQSDIINDEISTTEKSQAPDSELSATEEPLQDYDDMSVDDLLALYTEHIQEANELRSAIKARQIEDLPEENQKMYINREAM